MQISGSAAGALIQPLKLRGMKAGGVLLGTLLGGK